MRRIGALILGTGALLMLTTTTATAAPTDSLGDLIRVAGSADTPLSDVLDNIPILAGDLSES
ncbi:hypothetical protein [Streptomyces sp. Wb2n-11]|uniref:hypothetical protein n=1 Tax=Streptomyces sp. Wb2n-11 TaxID=1030533 RepID=UPI000A89F328|nr:hypothetical protein [Streptomyces sp. Wb2n-11]